MESTTGKLKRVARKHTLKLTHYGRKTGKPYEVTIWFVTSGDKIYLTTGNVNRQWVQNVFGLWGHLCLWGHLWGQVFTLDNQSFLT